MGTTGLVVCGILQSSVARRFDKRPSIMNSLWTKYQQTGHVTNRSGRYKACKQDKTDGRYVVTQVHKS